MKTEILIAGFGGQGILSMGKMLALAAMEADMEVSWFPAYGPEQRGGTASVTVILSHEPIPSPIINQYDVAVLLNQPSLDKYIHAIRPGGVLLYDSYGIAQLPSRTDIHIWRTDAMDTAIETKQPRTFNTLVLGSILHITNCVHQDNIRHALQHVFATKPQLVALNEDALSKGASITTLVSHP